MDDRIRKKLEQFKVQVFSEQSQLAQKSERTKEQQQLFKLLTAQAIDPALKECLAVCQNHQIQACFEHFYTQAYSVFCLDKKTVPRPGEGGMWVPALVVQLHYVDLEDRPSAETYDADCFEIIAVNIAKCFFKGKRFRRKNVVRRFDRRPYIVFTQDSNFSELTKELVSEALTIFLEAYLDMRLRR